MPSAPQRHRETYKDTYNDTYKDTYKDLRDIERVSATMRARSSACARSLSISSSYPLLAPPTPSPLPPINTAPSITPPSTLPLPPS